jgi:hypothetical protein
MCMVCVCVCLCKYAFLYVCTHVRMHICKYVHIYVCMHVVLDSTDPWQTFNLVPRNFVVVLSSFIRLFCVYVNVSFFLS